jgi:septal ring factor EnvC (AmiA/AmiB activator)
MAEEDLKQELAEAEDRVRRANERARDAEEGYRKLQMDIVAARDESQSLRDEIQAMGKRLVVAERELEEARAAAEKPRSAPPAPKPSPQEAELRAQVAQLLRHITDLRELLASASNELSQLHADEVALSAKRTRILGDACTLLARAVGETGEAPPPIPNVASRALEARLTRHPVVDISEVAELIESLRPPTAPKVE